VGAYNEESGELIMALDDSGNLYELTQQGWNSVGDPCPGDGPYRIELIKIESVDDNVFILVFDNEGRLFQADGTSWSEIMSKREGSIPPSLGILLNATDSDRMKTLRPG